MGFALLEKTQAAKQKHHMDNQMKFYKVQLIVYAIAGVLIYFDVFIWRA
jgi:hypothetical protein